jgi:hypothetical protein
MNPANVPTWGTPWHGLVQGGVLTLPNGSTMTYPQPPAKTAVISGTATTIPDTAGSTYLVAVPGVPLVTPSAEDVTAGREWRNKATLSASRQQLYGKSLDGWIYIDPDGARWLVRCAQLDENVLYSTGSSLALTVTLSRFGDLGVAAEQHSYPLTITSFGIDAGSMPSTVRVLLDAINSGGSAAILMVHERRMNSAEPQIRWPYAFLEITVSGPGSAATLGCSVIKPLSAVAQATRDFDLGPNYLAGYYTGPPGYSPTWRVQLQSAPTPPGEGNFSEWGGRVCQIYSGSTFVEIRRTVAIWYAADGSRKDVVCVTRWDGSVTLPTPTTSGRTSTGSASWTARIEAGGAPLCEVAGAWTATTVETMTGINTGTYTKDATVTVDGIDYPQVISGDMSSFFWEMLFWDYGFQYSAALAPTGLLPDLAWENGCTFSERMRLVRYSGQVVGLATNRGVQVSLLPPATPSGTAPGATITVSLAPFYGSHDPYSGAAVWGQSSPVCYV